MWHDFCKQCFSRFLVNLRGVIKLGLAQLVRYQCGRLVQLVRSLTANHEVPGSIPRLVEG